MPLEPGSRLGVYEVVGPIGAGGMGEVYRARDTKLNRDVALKILPASLADDPDRLARFEREAQVLASLNHPNIAAIYGIEDSGSTPALVLELVEGPTLADRLAAGALPVAEALAIARQVADALAAAHDAGVIHRDLKPANIKVRDDGAVKVLDFGLARTQDPGTSGPQDSANSPTLTARATELGTIIGTAAYMAPEQARGKAVDRRADLWAFGVVLYEMLTGRRAFDGDEISDVLAAVLRDTPPLEALPAGVPAGVRRLLRRTLEKDRARRLDSMTAARLELDDTETPETSAVAAAPMFRPRMVAAIAVTAAIAAAAAGGLVWRATRPAPPAAVNLTFSGTPAAPIAVETNHADVAITRDGSRIVYFSQMDGDNQFAVRALDQFDPVVILNIGQRPRGFSVSPNGQWLLFQTGRQAGANAALNKVPIGGGTPITLCPVSGNVRGTTWLSDDTVVFGNADRSQGLLQVSAAGGTPEVLTVPRTEDDELDHVWPYALPDGQHVLFAIRRSPSPDGDDEWAVGLLDLGTRAWRVLFEDGTSPQYSPSGHIVYGWRGSLKAVPFDLGRLQITGEAVPVVANVVVKASGAADFAVAENGTLVYRPGSASAPLNRFVWRDMQGSDTPVAVADDSYTTWKISPDGRQAVAATGTPGQGPSGPRDLWLIDLGREIRSRLAPAGFGSSSFVWSPDSRQVAFWLDPQQSEAGGIFVVSAAGTTPPRRLTTAAVDQVDRPSSWTRDGRLLFTRASQSTRGPAIMQLDVATGTVTPVLELGSGGQASPDGHWLAYITGGRLEPEVFIRTFPDVDANRIPVSSGGGNRPFWSASGDTLYYWSRSQQQLFAVSVTPAGGTIDVGRPRALEFLAAAPDNPPVNGRFLITQPVGEQDQVDEYRVILNWAQTIKSPG